MALREFIDVQGRQWSVWETIPTSVRGLGKFRHGWLTFDDGSERRRLAPVPEGWSGFTEERLALLVRIAHPSPAPRSHTTRHDGATSRDV